MLDVALTGKIELATNADDMQETVQNVATLNSVSKQQTDKILKNNASLTISIIIVFGLIIVSVTMELGKLHKIMATCIIALFSLIILQFSAIEFESNSMKIAAIFLNMISIGVINFALFDLLNSMVKLVFIIIIARLFVYLYSLDFRVEESFKFEEIAEEVSFILLTALTFKFTIVKFGDRFTRLMLTALLILFFAIYFVDLLEFGRDQSLKITLAVFIIFLGIRLFNVVVSELGNRATTLVVTLIILLLTFTIMHFGVMENSSDSFNTFVIDLLALSLEKCIIFIYYI